MSDNPHEAKPDDAMRSRFIAALYAPPDLILTRPTETWTGDGAKKKKEARVDFKNTTYTRQAAWPGVLDWHIEHAKETKCNIFFGVAPRHGGKGEYDKAWQIRLVRALWCDIDDALPDEALKRCESAGLPAPSIVVASGRGTHLYWLILDPYLIDDGDQRPVLTEWPTKADPKTSKKKPLRYIIDPATNEKLDQSIVGNRPALSAPAILIQDILSGIASKVGGDPAATDISRLLRVPETLNRKNERNGQAPTLCRLVSIDETRRYPLAEFIALAETAPAKRDREVIATVALPKPRKITATKQDKLDALILECRTASDRSRADWALTCWAIENGVAQDAVWSAVESVGKFAEQGRAYFDRTWDKAAGHTREKIYAKAKGKAECACDEGEGDDTDSSGAGIVVGIDEERVTDEAIAALARLPHDENGVYQRGACLVHIVPSAPKGRGVERPEGATTIAPLALDTLRERISTAATFFKRKDDDEYAPVAVPNTVVRAVHARGHWKGIPAIEAVVEAPVLRADGSVLEMPGFDEATGIYFWRGSGVFPPVPERPTLDDARAATEMLLDVVCDFPFANEASKSAYLAMQLTPFARFAFYGNAPLGLIEGNVPGCGKGLAADVLTTIWSEQGIAKTACPTDDTEFNKMITALAIAGEMMIQLDNVRGPLGGPALEAALTATTWSGRVLGQSKMTGKMPLNLIWLVTANNAILVGDLPRRVLNIRLESPLEQPEEREGFKYPNLMQHVREHRGELAVAACTVLRAFHLAGRPHQKLPAWGSFDEWSGLVRSAIAWCGLDDPAATRMELRERSDTEAQALRQLITGWQELDLAEEGLSVAQAIKRLDESPEKYAAAREAMADLFGHGKAKPASTKSIGRRLAGFRLRVVGGKRFESVANRDGTMLWVVRTAGIAGFAGFATSPLRESSEETSYTHAHAPAKGYGANPANPANPAGEAAGPCDHVLTERLTHDGYLRTECPKCGDVLEPDRKAVVTSA